MFNLQKNQYVPDEKGATENLGKPDKVTSPASTPNIRCKATGVPMDAERARNRGRRHLNLHRSPEWFRLRRMPRLRRGRELHKRHLG